MINVIATIVIIALLVVIGFFAVRSSIKHFKGEGDCCGGGGGNEIEIKKPLSEPEIGTKTVKISGMHCDNCRIRVQNSLNRIDGVSADVDLKKKEATLDLSREVTDNEIRRAVENAGYEIA